MKLSLRNKDHGAGLVEYALVVMFVGVVSMIAVTAVGDQTSQTFDTVAQSFDAGDVVEEDLSPDDKWDRAKEDYADAIDEAKAKKADDISGAKAEYNSKVAENKNLPKADRKAANQEAKADYNAARSQANADYKSSVKDATDARNAAKAEWKANR